MKMQAIVTKYLAPANFKGTRVKATCASGYLIVEWEYEMDVEANHQRAADQLVARFGWDGNKLIGGTLPNGDYCWVMVPATKEDTRCVICGYLAGE